MTLNCYLTQLQPKHRFCWRAIDVRTLGGGIPTGMSDMHAKMVDYYHHCQDMELERRMAMAD
jgi:hypothetical protein